MNLRGSKKNAEEQSNSEDSEWQFPTEREKLARNMRRVQERKRNSDICRKLSDWCRCRDLRELIAAVEADANERGLYISPNNGLGKWLVWARSLADSLDPTNAARIRFFHTVTEKDISRLPYLDYCKDEDNSDPWREAKG